MVNRIKLVLGLGLMLALTAPATVSGQTRYSPKGDWYLISNWDTYPSLWARVTDLDAGRPTNRAAKLWVFTEMKNKRFDEVKSLVVVDCLTNTYKHRASYGFKAKKQISTDDYPNPRVQFPVPGTNMETATKLLCQTKN